MLPTSRQKSPCYLAMTTTTTFSTTTVTNLGLRRRTQRPRYREPGSKEPENLNFKFPHFDVDKYFPK